MIGLVNVGKNAIDVTKSVQLEPYSKVVVIVDESTEYVAGDDTGLTLEVQCPWGDQRVADDILQKVQGYQYQPYTVTGAIVNPAAEMGDAVQANGVYGGMYQQDATFGRTFYSDFSAPEDEQLDHEFTYESPTERRITRQQAWTKSEFAIRDTEISARVKSVDGDSSSFGWSLTVNGFAIYSGGNTVLFCNSSGLQVYGSGTFSGHIEASSGTFHGNVKCQSITFDNGVTINGANITNGTIADGKIIGVSGTKVGAGIAGGNITAGTVASTQLGEGAVTEAKIGGGAVTNGKLGDSAVTEAKIGGGAVTGGKISSGAVSKTKTDTNVQTSLSNGDAAKAAIESLTAGSVQATKIWTKNIVAKDATLGMIGGTVVLKGNPVSVFKVEDTSGNTRWVYGHT